MVKVLKFLFSILFLTVLVFVLAYQSSLLTIKEIRINIESKYSLDAKNLEENLLEDLSHLYGQFIFFVTLKEILEIIKQDVRIQTITLERNFPNKISIFIKTYSPAVLLAGLKTGLHPVIRNGNILEKKSPHSLEDLPILRGLKFHKSLNLRIRAIRLLARVPRTGFFSQKNISEVHYNKDESFNLYLSLSGVIVKIKNLNAPEKSDQIEKVILYLKNQKLKDRIIDARLLKKIVVKLRNEP